MSQELQTAAAELVRQRYLEVDTSSVADVLDELGLHDQGLRSSFTPYPASASKMAGWAHTILGETRTYRLADRDPDKMAACAQLTPGSVSVWAGAGEGICFFGELIATGMKERGCVGALVDGGVRDVARIGQQDFPVYARYRTPVQSIGRWKVVDSSIPVTMPGATTDTVTVHPGDFVLADEDGALIIPANLAEQVLERAETLSRIETEIRHEVTNGLSLVEALTRFGHV